MPEETPRFGEEAIDTETGHPVWWDGYGWSYDPPPASSNGASAEIAGRALLLLNPQERPARIPLSFAQSRLWLLDQLEGGSTEYNMPELVRLHGNLDVKAMEQTIDAIVERHESLRTHFAVVDGEPVQIIEPERRIPLNVEDLSGLDEVSREQGIAEALRQEWMRPFDLRHGPLLRMKLLRLGPVDHILLRTFHHIVSDGWSQGVFNREFMLLYQAFHERRKIPLLPLPVQYADFALWQRRWLTGEVLHSHLDYWIKRLAGIPEQLSLPHDRPRDVRMGLAAGLCRSVLARDKLMALRRNAAENHVSLYMLLLSVYAVLLQRYSRQQDIVIGSPIANRQDPQLEQLIGFFVNSLVMRIQVDPSATFSELLATVRANTLEAYLHQDLPFERLVEELAPQRVLGCSPVFQVLFALQNAPVESQKLQDLHVESQRVRGEELRTRFDLELAAWEREGEMEFIWVYNRHLFDAWHIEQMARHYSRLLDIVLASPERRICEMDLKEKEKRQLLAGRKPAHPEALPYTSLIDWFQQQAASSPHAIALTVEEKQLSYAGLNQRANRVAHYLRGLGVAPEVRVGLCFERGIQMLVGLLGVLKAGGTYVPLDPGHPAKRQAYVIADSGMDLLLTSSGLLKKMPPGAVRAILTDDEEEFANQPCDDLPRCLVPCNTAYVIYTSGSTGKPKGVEVTHANVIRLFQQTQPWFNFSGRDIWTLFHSYAFDFSVWEIWGAWLYGGRLVVVPYLISRSPEEFLQLLVAEKVTVLNQTPSAFQHLIRACESSNGKDQHLQLRLIIFGGEALEFQSLSSWTGRHGAEHPQLINMYGITETTVHVTYYQVTQKDVESGCRSKIGLPIPDLYTVICDEYMDPTPLGVPGELLVGGAGLARGYLHRSALTAERFAPDPFSHEPGARLYRSGDLAACRADGTLEYLGRIDHQVKIRGYRIELGEIEAALKAGPQVQDALVMVQERSGEQQLIGYVVARQSQDLPDNLQASHVLHWQELYESTYLQDRVFSGDFNIVGWNSSYTGQPIPSGEMRIWVDETVARIKALGASRVLEVGCGTGLLLTRLAPGCQNYTGIDFSGAVLEHLQKYIEQQPDLSHVALRQGMAHELSFAADDSVDLVVLNSVVQYFPNMDYLLRTLAEAVRVTRPGGHIFIGDVRSLPLLEAYHTSVQLHKAAAGDSLEELRRRIVQARISEEELVVDPALFAELAQSWEKLGRAEFALKAGAYDNELSRFRYDVVLSLGAKETLALPAEWLEWDAAGQWTRAVEKELNGHPGISVGVRGIPDCRVAGALETVRLLHESGRSLSDAEQLRALCSEFKAEDPDFVIRLAQGLNTEIFWQPSSTTGIYGVVFNPRWQEQTARQQVPEGDYLRFGNAPASRDEELKLARQLQDSLRQSLPDYMLPAAVVVLKSWPLTANGKIDRKALPVPERHAKVRQLPRTPAEELLAAVWIDILGLVEVDIHANFFELGGHSLLAARLISRIRDAFRLEIPLRLLFEFPTIAGLAACIDGNEIGQREHRDIEVLDRNSELPLSFNQEASIFREWWAGIRSVQAPPFHMALTLSLKGALDLQALQHSMHAIIARHEVFRTSFSGLDKQPSVHQLSAIFEQSLAPQSSRAVRSSALFTQTVHSDASFSMAIKDLEGLSPEQQKDRLTAIFIEECDRPFDFHAPPLMRAVLMKRSAAEHLLVLVLHHLLGDGWSLQLLQKELTIFYQRFSGKCAQDLPQPAVQYADFANWQRNRLGDGTFDALTAYWKTQWREFSPLNVHDLPFARSGRPDSRGHSSAGSIAVRSAAYANLKAFAQQQGITVYMLLLAALHILLHLYSGKERIAVWVNFANRTRSEFEDVIGWFANSHILGSSLCGSTPVWQVLERVREAVIEGSVHQALPNSLLWTNVLQNLDKREKRRRVYDSDHIFFDVANEFPSPASPGLLIEPLPPPVTRNTEYPLYVMGSLRSQEMVITVRYATGSFLMDDICAMLEDLRIVLDKIISAPCAVISEIPVSTRASASSIAR